MRLKQFKITINSTKNYPTDQQKHRFFASCVTKTLTPESFFKYKNGCGWVHGDTHMEIISKFAEVVWQK
jgi:hypothetical protein